MVLCQHLSISSYIRITLLGPGYQEKGRGADSQWPFSIKRMPIRLTPSPHLFSVLLRADLLKNLSQEIIYFGL